LSCRTGVDQGAPQGSIQILQNVHTIPASIASGRKNIKLRSSERCLKRLKIQAKTKILTLKIYNMKKLNNSLFKKFESKKINDLAKIVGGLSGKTSWTGSNGTSGCDYFYDQADYPCIGSECGNYPIGGGNHYGDMTYIPC
jgi:hypothetical protein